MHNRITLDDIPGRPIGEIAALPPDQRALLAEEAAEALDRARRVYVRTELKVAETAYGSWSTAIRRLFEPARTIETGKPSYRIEPAGKRAA